MVRGLGSRFTVGHSWLVVQRSRFTVGHSWFGAQGSRTQVKSTVKFILLSCYTNGTTFWLAVPSKTNFYIQPKLADF